MRDIRQDLRDRLHEIEAERKKLEERERSLRELLRLEEVRWGSPEQGNLFVAKPQPSKVKLSQRKRAVEPSEKTKFLLETLADRRPWPIDLLVEAAEERGIDFEGKRPKRVLHFVLIGMKQRGMVEKIGENEWMLTASLEGESDAATHH